MDTLNDFDKPEGFVNVKLHKCNLEGSVSKLYGKVNRRTVGLSEIVAMASDKNTGVTELNLMHAASILQKQILELFSLGYSVNVLDLCTMYLKTNGSINSQGESSLVQAEAGFTPGVAVKEACKNIVLTGFEMADSSPYIESVYDKVNKDNPFVLYTGGICVIKGKKLKLGKNDSYIYLVPALENNGYETDRAKWIKVDNKKVYENKPSVLEFVLDKDTPSGKYFIAVSTSYINGRKERKTALTGISGKSVLVKQ